MNNSTLKQLLLEYSRKRNKEIADANIKKEKIQELYDIYNPVLLFLKSQISLLSIFLNFGYKLNLFALYLRSSFC